MSRVVLSDLSDNKVVMPTNVSKFDRNRERTIVFWACKHRRRVNIGETIKQQVRNFLKILKKVSTDAIFHASMRVSA